MAEDTVRMVTESIDAFVKGDLELCRKVIDDDDKVDDAFNDIKEKLAEIAMNNGKPGCKPGWIFLWLQNILSVSVITL